MKINIELDTNRSVGVPIGEFRRDTPEALSYGTAGYRADAAKILDIVHRGYLVCALRSATLGSPVGLMLTASHNKEEDNGIKYVDYDGNMFGEAWEAISDSVVNARNEDLGAEVGKRLNSAAEARSLVFVGRDTRASGAQMVDKCRKANERWGDSAHVLVDIGVVSTPQMHFLIRELHRRKLVGYPGPETIGAIQLLYYQRVRNYCRVVQRVFRVKREERVLDTANGVARFLQKALKDSVGAMVALSILSNTKKLNEECGSDYIKTKESAPAGISVQGDSVRACIEKEGGPASVTLPLHAPIASFDGDADRLIYFVLSPALGLVDGDRLCLMLISFLNHLITVSGAPLETGSAVTAYANGACISALEKRGGVRIGETGVKNMQRESRHYDVGVWFESNGHGTVYFSDRAVAEIRRLCGSPEEESFLDLGEEELERRMDDILSSNPRDMNVAGARGSNASPYDPRFPRMTQQDSLLMLLSLCSLFDPAIGDAFVNLAVCESVFASRFMSAASLLNTYQPVPSALEGVRVQRKESLTAEAKESLESKYAAEGARVHLRASGTEDLVRIYVEGASKEKVAEIAEKLKADLSAL